MDVRKQLRLLTGEKDEDLLSILLDQAEDRILLHTNRSELPGNLLQTQVDWALVAYNRIGMEGETSRSEGGVSSSFAEIPKEIQGVLNMYRLARVSGRAYEKKSTKKI